VRNRRRLLRPRGGSGRRSGRVPGRRWIRLLRCGRGRPVAGFVDATTCPGTTARTASDVGATLACATGLGCVAAEFTVAGTAIVTCVRHHEFELGGWQSRITVALCNGT
jgi:hypothetical protein